MKKVWCDLCGKPISKEEDRFARSHFFMLDRKGSTVQYDACENCDKKIADFVAELAKQ